jgi:hypothetical protein
MKLFLNRAISGCLATIGDSLKPKIFEKLLQGKAAKMILQDPPFNVKI